MEHMKIQITCSESQGRSSFFLFWERRSHACPLNRVNGTQNEVIHPKSCTEELAESAFETRFRLKRTGLSAEVPCLCSSWSLNCTCVLEVRWKLFHTPHWTETLVDRYLLKFSWNDKNFGMMRVSYDQISSFLPLILWRLFLKTNNYILIWGRQFFFVMETFLNRQAVRKGWKTV